MRNAASELASRAFSSVDFSGGAVVAVSGGSDSTALLLLLKSHFDRNFPTSPLLAVTVDHALRPGSADEAAAVARLCATHSIAHRTLVWSGSKPETGLPAAAREARYGLLSQAARGARIPLVVTGHTADDQAETVWMRQVRAGETSALGLAGMAPATLHDGAVWIVRPLLGIRRAALRDHLRGMDIGWFDDPTNADRRFERPRLRQSSGGQIAEGGETLALAGRAARAREDINRRAADLLRAFASMPAPGLVRLDPAFAHGDDRAAALHTLRILLAVVGGTTFLPNNEAATAVLARLMAGTARATLSRCVVDARRAGVFLHREHRDLPHPCPAGAGMVWDGRRRITADNGDSLIVGPRGLTGKRTGAAAALPPSLVDAARAAEPALWPATPGAGLIDTAAPHCFEPVLAPWRLFLPSFDLVAARAVADLVGAPAIPGPPFLDSVDPGATAIA